MIKDNTSIENRLLSKVSSLYYDQNYTQKEIANRLHLSRPKISRLLKQARKEGIVRISVVSPSDNFVSLENALEEKYSLKEALVIDADASDDIKITKHKIGSAAAKYLHRTASEGDTIGLTWGTTLQAMVDAMLPKAIDDIRIVQALGGVGPPEAKAYATDISRRLSQLLESSLTLLPAPGIVGSIQAKEVLLSDRKVKGALDLFAEINTLFAGIGAINTNLVLDQENGEIPSHLYEKIINSNAVGEIAFNFFDIHGNNIDSDLKDLVIGISIKEILQIDTVVGLAGGKEKMDVVRGAVNGELINVLVTDNLTAERLIDE